MAKRIYQKKAKVVHNSHLIKNYYKLALHFPEIARIAQPGQFVMLRVSGCYRPFLRRPFSIHRICQASHVTRHTSKIKKPCALLTKACDLIEILYEVIGKGTEILSQKKAGEYLDMIGPLGNGFTLNIKHPTLNILVAGGMGVAPLFFLAQKLMERNLKPEPRTPKPEPRNPIILIGARTKREILSQKEFANLGFNVKISTDDGSVGFKGKVTDLLRRLLSTVNCQLSTIYACGPKPMLNEIAIISKQYNIPAQISLDEYMACGLGVCLGCMVRVKGGQKFVCRDGPVFDSSEIRW